MKISLTTQGIQHATHIDPELARNRLRNEHPLHFPHLPHAMLRALEANNLGRMHQIAAFMGSAWMAKTLPSAILDILLAPEDNVEITGAEAKWAFCRRNPDTSWEVLLIDRLDVLREWRGSDLGELAIVHLPTGIPEYLWTEIESPGTSSWWRWMEAPIRGMVP